MKIVQVDAVVAERGLNSPTILALIADVNTYSVLLAQPQGDIEADPAGVRNHDGARASVQFAQFIDKAIETAADVAVTPEYSMPWNTLMAALLGGKSPTSGKLWAFGCESITLAELNSRKAELNGIAQVIFEPLNVVADRFLDPLVYVFTTEASDNDAKKLVLLVQFKTYPMGDPSQYENAHLQLGTAVYQFGSLATGLRLVSLICSDVFGFTDAEAKTIYDRALVLHIQLNPQPRHHQYRQYRELLFRYHGDETELLCLNWAAGVCERSNGKSNTWKGPTGSAWYLRPKEFDAADSTLCANHKRGLYYTWLESSRAHVLFLNYNSGVYLLEATKVAHPGVVASVARRVGPKLRRVFTWAAANGVLSEQPSSEDGFAAILAQAGGAQASLQMIYEANPLAAERVLALCAGKIHMGKDWYTVGALDSFAIDTSEVIRRLTFCQDVEPAASEFRAIRLQRCASLWQILLVQDNLPTALSDIAGGFRLDWQEGRPHQNIMSAADKPATAIYLGEDISDAQIEAVATSIAEYLRRSAANDDDGISARQRAVVWYRRNGQLMLHDRDRYVQFDETRSGSEFDITRQVRT